MTLPGGIEEVRWEELAGRIKRVGGGFYLDAIIDPQRAYDGQPHTHCGERGRTIIEGLTMRDLVDCYVVGCYESSGLASEEYPESIFELPWDQIDPMAVAQNMLCEIERRMGIFPNVPGLEAKWRSWG